MNTTMENLRQAHAALCEVLATEPDNHEKLLKASQAHANATGAWLQETAVIETPDFVSTTGVFVKGVLAGDRMEPPFDDFHVHLIPGWQRRRLLSQ